MGEEEGVGTTNPPAQKSRYKFIERPFSLFLNGASFRPPTDSKEREVQRLMKGKLNLCSVSSLKLREKVADETKLLAIRI